MYKMFAWPILWLASRVRLLSVLFLLSFSIPFTLVSEEFKYAGLQFSNVQVEPVGGDSVRVTDNADTQILTKGKYETDLAIKLLKEGRLAPEERAKLPDFIKSVIVEPDRGSLLAALACKIYLDLQFDESVLNQIQMAGKFDSFVSDYFRNFPQLSKNSAQIILKSLWVSPGLVQRSWFSDVKGNTEILIAAWEEALKTYFGTYTLEQVIAIQKTLQSEIILANYKLMAIGAMLDKLSESLKSLQEGKVEQAFSLYESGLNTYNSKPVEEAIVVLSIDQAKSFLNENKSFLAICALSLGNFHYRTPDVHKLFLSAVESMQIDSLNIWSFERTNNYIDALINKDPAIQLQLVNTIERNVTNLVSSPESFEIVKNLLAKLSIYRPNHEESNNSIRVEAILALHSKGSNAEAMEILKSLTNLSFANKFKLFVSGVLISKKLILTIVLFPVLVGVIGYFYLKARDDRKEMEASEEELERLPPGRNLYRRDNADPRVREYLELLKVLKVDQGASEKDIKKAYRESVKKIHPDLRQTTADITSEFVKLKDIYERLIALRQELGIHDG